MSAERATRDGYPIVEVESLVVGDRLRFVQGEFWPVIEIEEYPKTRRIICGVQSTGQVIHRTRMRRTTLVARAPRASEVLA